MVCASLELEEKITTFATLGMTDPMQLTKTHAKAYALISRLQFTDVPESEPRCVFLLDRTLLRRIFVALARYGDSGD